MLSEASDQTSSNTSSTTTIAGNNINNLPIVPLFKSETTHLHIRSELPQRKKMFGGSGETSPKQFLESSTTSQRVKIAHGNTPTPEGTTVDRTFGVVGSKWGGKTTFLSHLRQLYGKKYSIIDKASLGDRIRGSILKSFVNLLGATTYFLEQEEFLVEHHEKVTEYLLNYKFTKELKSSSSNTATNPEPRSKIDEMRQLKLALKSMPLSSTEFNDIKSEVIEYFESQKADLHGLGLNQSNMARALEYVEKLWKDKLIQLVYTRYNHRHHVLQVLTNLDYWMNHSSFVFGAKFTPRSKDILRYHDLQQGIESSNVYSVHGVTFVGMDISKLDKITHVFNLQTDIIFVIGLNDYELIDENGENRLEVCVSQFRRICEMIKTHFLEHQSPLKRLTLVLNKFDTFMQKAKSSTDTFLRLELNHPEIFTYYGTTIGTAAHVIRAIIDYFVNIYDSYFRDIRNFPLSIKQVNKFRLTSPSLNNSVLNVCVTSALDRTNMEDFWNFILTGYQGIEQRAYSSCGSWIPFRMCRSSLHTQYGSSYLNWGETIYLSTKDFGGFQFAVHDMILETKCPELAKMVEREKSNGLNPNSENSNITSISINLLTFEEMAEIIRRMYDGCYIDLVTFRKMYHKLKVVELSDKEKSKNKPKIIMKALSKLKKFKKSEQFRFNTSNPFELVDYSMLFEENQSILPELYDILLFHQNGSLKGYKFMLSVHLPGFVLERNYHVLVPYFKISSYQNVLRMLNHVKNIEIRNWDDLVEMIYISKMWKFDDNSLLVERLKGLLRHILSPENVFQLIPYFSKDCIDFSTLPEHATRLSKKKWTLLDRLPSDCIHHISSFLYGAFKTNPSNSLIDQDYLSFICSLGHTAFFTFLANIPQTSLKQFVWKTKHTDFSLFLRECQLFVEKHHLK